MFRIKKLSYRVFSVFMVVALLLGFAVTPAAGANGDDVQIDVHAPEAVYVCTEFYVNATIANLTDDPIDGVVVGISWDTTAAELLDPSGTSDQPVGDLASGAVGDVWWKFHCLKPGSLEFSVSASSGGTYVPTELIGTGTATVEQMPVPDPVLVIEVIQQPDYPVTPCENFAIKAKVHNLTNEPVGGVTVTITKDLDGEADPVSPTSVSVGTIRAGGSQEVGFTWHCTGTVDATFLLDADFDGEKADPSGQVTTAAVYVVQAGTWLDVELSTDWRKLCSTACSDSNTAIVTAKVTNDGDEIARGVEVELALNPGDAVISPTGAQGLPDIPVGGFAEYSWDVTCTGTADADLTATATADNAPDDATSGALDIVQGDGLLIEILEPDPVPTYSVGQEFPVKVRITNCSGAQINTTVTITETAHSSLVVGSDVLIEPWYTPYTEPVSDTVSLGNICACCYVDVTWMMQCDGAALGESIKVEARGGGGEVDVDEVEIKQVAKAHLTAGIEVFPGWESDGTLNVMPVDAVAVGQNFTIVVPVVNLGEADADNVIVTKTVVGPTDCAGVHTYNLGTIKGGESKKYIEECHCEGEGPVTIYVEMSGMDENTGEAIPQDNIDIPCPKTLHQKAITVEYLEPLEGEEFTVCDFFAVKVKIENKSDQDLAGVSGCLSWNESEAELVGGSKCYYFPGQEDSVLKAGATHELTWQMHCKHKGELTFLFKLISEVPRMKIERTVTVVQNPAPPEWEQDEVPYCQLWNLISLPLIPEDPDIERVLSRTGNEIVKVAHYTGGPAGDWKFYSPGAPSDLTQMVDGKGYWMDVRAMTTDPWIRVYGYEHCGPPPAVPPYYEVVEGWNMIGFQSTIGKAAQDYLAGLGDDLMVIYEFDCNEQLYQIVLPAANLDPGKGYLIALTGPGTIYP